MEQGMRIVFAAALACVSALAASVDGVQAFDNTQFCQAVTQWANAAVGDAGTWLDRSTRNDGVEIICNRKIVHFKRFSNVSASALQGSWREAKAEEWQSGTCARSMWREAVENGWVVSATVTTKGGQRLWFGCQPGGIGFHRVLP